MSIKKNGIVYMNQGTIAGQTFHWHDEQELMIVVEGSIDLKVGYEWLNLKEGDIMLINSDEIHCLRETDEKNVVISVYIDCNAIYNMYPDFYEIVAIWPYSEAFSKLNQRRQHIMDYVNKLALLLDADASVDEIKRGVDDFLNSIIYCYRLDITDLNGAAFQVPDEKKDMIYRTIKYLYSNYDHKVNLQDISEQEYMSMFYLSHQFKDITGYSFRDWLNFVRVEKAEKLLLKTDTSVTDIAYQCGFSDVRYFNKHFSKWYKISPTKYRQLFKNSYEKNNDVELFQENVPMRDIIDKIEAVVPEEQKVSYENVELLLENHRIENKTSKLDSSWTENLWCSSFSIADHRGMKRLEEVQHDIGFVAVTVDELFSTELHQTEDMYAKEVYEILSFLLDMFSEVKLIVRCSMIDQYEIDAAESAIIRFFKFYPKGRAAQLQFIIHADDDESMTTDRIDSFVRTLDSLRIRHIRKGEYKEVSSVLDSIESVYIRNMLDGEIRMEWLYSKNGFKNNLYYIYFFLSHMEEHVLISSENYLVTCNDNNGYQILLHNDGLKLRLQDDINYRFSFKQINSDYKLVRYTWNVEQDDVSAIIKKPNVIKHLSDIEYEMISKSSIPMISVDYIDCNSLAESEISFELPVKASSMELILLTKIE